MNRAQISLVLALVVVFGLRLGSPGSDGISMIFIPQQRVVAQTIQDKRVLIRREGQVFSVWDAASGYQDAPVRWCPYEEVFWAAKTHDLFDAKGNHARGPGRNNLVQLGFEANQEDGILHVDVDDRRIPMAREADIAPGIMDFFERYLNQLNIPGGKRLIFCPNPVH